jgi:hypothetical protein
MKKALLILYLIFVISYLVLCYCYLAYDIIALEKPVNGLTALILGITIYRDLKFK